MTQQSGPSQAPQSAEGAVTTAEARKLFNGSGHVSPLRQSALSPAGEAATPRVRVAPETVREVIFMHIPHADELVAWVILTLLGRVKYPGVEFAPARIRAAQDNFRILQDDADHGKVILLGDGGRMGNGIFDEHAGGKARKECVTLGVARDLGLNQSPRKWLLWKQIVGNITRIDTQGSFFEGQNLVLLGTNIWEAKIRQGRPLDQVLEQVQDDVAALIADNEALLETTSPHSEEKVEFQGRKYTVWYLRDLNLASRGDQEEVRAARLLGADLVVAQSNTNHAQILRGSQFPMQAMIRVHALVCARELVRQAEAQNTAPTMPADPRSLFEFDGEGVNERSSSTEKWFFDPRTGHLLNGGESHINVTPPTILTVEEIQERINIALDDAKMGERITATFGDHLKDPSLRSWLKEKTGLPKS